jgi:hypothetical protein
MRCPLIPLLVLLLVSTVRAQAPTPPEGAGAAGTELLEINERLEGLQDQAMRDANVLRENGELQQIVSAAMEEIDPETAARRARLLRIVDQLAEAQEAKDDGAYDILAEEGATLEAELRTTQQAAFAHESVVLRLEAFQAILMTRMTEIDPATPRLVDRAGELMENLP